VDGRAAESPAGFRRGAATGEIAKATRVGDTGLAVRAYINLCGNYYRLFPMRAWSRHVWTAIIASVAGHLLLYGGFFLFVLAVGDGVAGTNRVEKGLNAAGNWFWFTAHTTVPITVFLLFVFATMLGRSAKPQMLTIIFSLLVAVLTPFFFVGAQSALNCLAGRGCGLDLEYVGLTTAFGFLITLPSAIAACIIAFRMTVTSARKTAPG